MAVTLRLYRAAKLGTGTDADPYRSALSRYITEDRALPPGERSTFEVWIPDPVETALGFYSLAWATADEHAACAADPDVLVLSPQCADVAALQTWLDGELGSVSAAVRNTIEGDGIPIDGLTTTSTRRQLMRRIARVCHVGGHMLSQRDFTALQFLRQNLSTTRSQLPSNVRTRILAWLTEHGLSADWTTGQTTVRELLVYIAQNVELPPRFVARFRNVVI